MISHNRDRMNATPKVKGVEVIHVEVCQAVNSSYSKEQMQKVVINELTVMKQIPLNVTLTSEKVKFIHKATYKHVVSIYCDAGKNNKEYVSQEEIADFQLYIYQLSQEAAAMEAMQNEEEISASTHWILPSAEFHGLWDNLFYDGNIKEQLLNFVETAMIYSDHKVDPNVISWNKVVLLHGPPGTGKTSLCKALAQKITIRLSNQFARGELIEINSHSLFSKWFSESGKLVMNLFTQIRSLLEDTSNLVCILIDEVESLAHTRKSCSNGSEPSDSIRVVNALLTQIDSLKRHPNVLILTTSNLMDAIDLAFVDRADIKQFIPTPSYIAIYKIYVSCIKELMRSGFIEKEQIPEYEIIVSHQPTYQTVNLLRTLILQSTGLSGRTLRKIPFLAHALFQSTEDKRLSKFLDSMNNAIQHEKISRSQS